MLKKRRLGINRTPHPKTLNRKRQRAKKSEKRKLKETLWKLCKAIILKRYGNTCYTCGKTNLEGSGCQLGHFITSSLCSIPLRYDIRHLRIQCFHCNINLSGNWPSFQKRMEEEFPGITSILLKENEQTKGKTYTTQYFVDKIAEYESLMLN